MKVIFHAIIFLIASLTSAAQTNYITISPGSCPNCMAASELIKHENNVYVMKQDYNIDSSSYRRKYAFLKNAVMIFSDSLFDLYSINGMMTISNRAGTMKCMLANFNSKAHFYFTLWNSSTLKDTFTYEYPLSKRSVTKKVFTNEGKVYLLNQADNNVIVFDLLHNVVVDTISIPEKAKQDAYAKFNKSDTNGYVYYKHELEGHIPDELCTISDISAIGDSLYLSISNYFFYEQGEMKYITHFQSISTYNKGRYINTYVPTNIKERVLDSTVKFYAEVTDIYKYNNDIYTSIYNTNYHEDGSDYVIGKYNLVNNKLTCVSKLSEEFKGRYDFSNPIFSKQYYVLSKSSKLYNAETGSMTDLAYFKQELRDDKGISGFPKYYNIDMSVDDRYYNILYSTSANSEIYYAKIDRTSNRILKNDLVLSLDPNLITKIDPYDNNYLIQFYNNDKVIRLKVN